MKLYALVFIVINYLPGSIDVTKIDTISKNPYLSNSLADCEQTKSAIMKQTKQKNLHGFCIEVER